MFNYPKWKIVLIGVLSALGVFFCVPNFLPQAQRDKLPEWWRPLTLGLDLQGGSQLLLQVNLDQVVKDQMGAVEDAVRNAVSIGGDSDTIGCIAGSIAEPLYGVPAIIREQALHYMPEKFKELIRLFEERYGKE